jgi:hypothetical protein
MYNKGAHNTPLYNSKNEAYALCLVTHRSVSWMTARRYSALPADSYPMGPSVASSAMI